MSTTNGPRGYMVLESQWTHIVVCQRYKCSLTKLTIIIISLRTVQYTTELIINAKADLLYYNSHNLIYICIYKCLSYYLNLDQYKFRNDYQNRIPFINFKVLITSLFF